MAKNSKPGKVSAWLVIGVIVLIVLLFCWQTCATAAGDTDVSSESNFASDNVEMPANLQNQDQPAANPEALPAAEIETVIAE